MSSVTVCFSAVPETNTKYLLSENTRVYLKVAEVILFHISSDVCTQMAKFTFGLKLVTWNWVIWCASSSTLSSRLSPPSEHFYNQQMPYRGLPLKHTPLTSSIGSVTTLTTVADEEGADEEVEELGRVAGWVTSFDRLLADPLGVQCLLVSVCGSMYTCVCMCVFWCVHVCLHFWMHDFVCWLHLFTLRHIFVCQLCV